MKKIKRLFTKIYLTCCSSSKFINYYRKKGMQIGVNCEINKSINIITEPYLIKIGDNVRITSDVKFITHDGGLYVPRHMETIKSRYPDIEKSDKFGPIIIGNNVHIGVGAIIMPGVTIGSNVIIGAGSVVTKDILDNSVAVGVPAKTIKTIEEYVENNLDRIVYTKNMTFSEKKDYLCGLSKEKNE